MEAGGLSKDPLEVIEDALSVLDQRLVLRTVPGPSTHTVLVAADLEHPEVPPALGRYLVGVIAGAVDIDATLNRELFAVTADSRRETRRRVYKLARRSNAIRRKKDRRFRDYTRNPWIAEGIGHALLVLRKRGDTLCLEGPVRALKQLHSVPSEQGFDLLGLYEHDSIGVVVGEAKASRSYGVTALDRAAKFFREVERGDRGPDIRAEVHALKWVLPEEVRADLKDAFWRQQATYLPVIAHACELGELDDHAGLGSLECPPSCRRLLALKLNDFHRFFDAVATEMRQSVEELAPRV